jgi:hypothetical protein
MLWTHLSAMAGCKYLWPLMRLSMWGIACSENRLHFGLSDRPPEPALGPDEGRTRVQMMAVEGPW